MNYETELEAVLREFVSDVEAGGGTDALVNDWPDLMFTYQKARILLKLDSPDQERRIARWESISGKHWVDLFYHPAFKFANGLVQPSVRYRTPGGLGSLGNISETDAIAAIQTRVDRGLFQPDANTTPMRRVL